MKKDSLDIVVIGGGPGGYAAAFYLAAQGQKVTLIEKAQLGGVCLNRGCIPSKSLLNMAHLIEEARAAKDKGLDFGGDPKIDLDKLRTWKQSVVEKLSGGIAHLAKAKGVDVINGRAYFEDGQTLRIETEKGQKYASFNKAVIATGSSAAMPATFDLGNPRIMTATEALNIEDIPKELLVVGGGYIGMELGQVYAMLGSKVTVVEAMPRILMGLDNDLLRPFLKKADEQFEDIRLNCSVTKMKTVGKQIGVEMTQDGKKISESYDRVLIAVGRRPNSDEMGLENTGVQLDDRGYIKVNDQQQTAESSIYAIGDIVGGALLAHKASREAKIAANHIIGEVSNTEYALPAVVFTDPEIATVGLTESEAKEKKIKVKVAKCPWSASGRALSFGDASGLTKLIMDPDTNRILGVGIVGRSAGELIAEATLAVEMGATADDFAETVHAHPTLSETILESAELALGHAIHLT